MMSDEQRAALEGRTFVSTHFGNMPGEYVLKARNNDDGEYVLIEEDGTVHPYVDSRARTTRVTPADLPLEPA